jgi:hypothetical protein
MDSTPFTKVLGLFWNRETDTLFLPIVNLSPFCASGATKRDVLRGISSVLTHSDLSYHFGFLPAYFFSKSMEDKARLGRATASKLL